MADKAFCAIINEKKINFTLPVNYRCTDSQEFGGWSLSTLAILAAKNNMKHTAIACGQMTALCLRRASSIKTRDPGYANSIGTKLKELMATMSTEGSPKIASLFAAEVFAVLDI